MNEVKFLNCTPHEIRVGDKVFPISGYEVRAKQNIQELGELNGIRIIKMEFTEPEIPEPVLEHIKNGGAVIVSSLAAQAIKKYHPIYQSNVLVPALPVRDEKGRIIGSGALAQI